MAITNISEQLDRDEGNIPYAYQDHLGFWTVGKGFLIDKRKGGGLRPEEIEFILNNRLALIRAQLSRALPWVGGLDRARLGVLENMAYQMGVEGLLAFRKFLNYLSLGAFDRAAEEMLDSTWAKQTPERAKRLSVQIKTGVWQ